MSEVLNLTPYAAAFIPSMSRDDRELTLLVVQGRFALPPAGAPRREELTPLEERGDIGFEDTYRGDPETGSLETEGQSAYTRHGTDVYLRGHAWAPGERAVSKSNLGLRIGTMQKVASVFGERIWTRGLGSGGLRPGRPVPFTSIPLCYERCLGGNPPNPSKADARLADHNPTGCGLYANARNAIGERLPNFEDPKNPIQGYGGWPMPHGFGPIARHWQPRRALAGTYDDKWLEERVPLWPHDLDERFFSAASPGLCAVPHLVGGEPVRVVGMSGAGDYDFWLPLVVLQARFELGQASPKRRLVLDGIDIDTDAGTLTMTWRTHIAVGPLSVSSVVLRALERWEVAA